MFNPYPKQIREPKISAKKKQQSDKMAKLSAEYHKILGEIDQERHPWCENCGKNEFDHSHLVKRDFNNYAYMNVKANIRRNCREDHLAWEAGKLWLFPKLGPIYLEIVKELDEQYHRQKMEQFRKRLEKYKNDNWLALSNKQLKLPDWIGPLMEEYFN